MKHSETKYLLSLRHQSRCYRRHIALFCNALPALNAHGFDTPQYIAKNSEKQARIAKNYRFK